MFSFLLRKKPRESLAEKIARIEALEESNKKARLENKEQRIICDATMNSWDKRRKPINP